MRAPLRHTPGVIFVTIPPSRLPDTSTVRRARGSLVGRTHVRVRSSIRTAVALAAVVLFTLLGDAAGRVPAAAYAAAPSWSSAPFVSRPSKKTWYRIPAIVQNARGDLLAFAERRDSGTSDSGDFEIVMKRSTDGGRTWGALKVVADDGTGKVSNPVPVFVPSTGAILLVTSVRSAGGTYKGVYVQRSTDGGTTFSALSKGRVTVQGSWRGGSTGPGHGIVLASGSNAGRIIVPLGYRTSSYYGAYCIYSDDGGVTWRTGYDQADTSGNRAFIEGTVAELPGDKLFISYRDKLNTTPGRARHYALSTNGGLSLSLSFTRLSAPKTPSVQSSLLGLTGSRAGTLLISAPSFAYQGRPYRRDMAIYASTNGGKTWSRPYQVDVESRDAAYSDLVQIDDSTVGVLYEDGTDSWREDIRFRQVPVSEITATTRLKPTVKAKLSAKKVSTKRHARVKVKVRAPKTGSPPGSITVTYKRAGHKTGKKTVRLTYNSKGTKSIMLPRLKRGTYTVKVTYSGTSRLSSKTVRVGRLRVR